MGTRTKFIVLLGGATKTQDARTFLGYQRRPPMATGEDTELAIDKPWAPCRCSARSVSRVAASEATSLAIEAWVS